MAEGAGSRKQSRSGKERVVLGETLGLVSGMPGKKVSPCLSRTGVSKVVPMKGLYRGAVLGGRLPQRALHITLSDLLV